MKQIKWPLFSLILLWLVSLACGRDTSPIPPLTYTPGNHHETVTVDERERTYIVHVPPQIEGNTPLPLIIVLHGSYGSGRKMQLGVGFDELADARGFLVAYPDAYDGMRWNDGRGTLASSDEGVDDVAFIRAMIDDIASQATVAENQVFVTGASNGGMMTYRLGCEAADVLAGIAPVIANLPEPLAESCVPSTPIAFLSINGVDDPLVPLDGGDVCAEVRRGCEGGQVIAAEGSREVFAAASHCSLSPTSITLPTLVDDGTSVEEITYPDCQAGAPVVAYLVHGSGHTWPPLNPQLGISGQPTANLDATQVIVDFFLPD